MAIFTDDVVTRFRGDTSQLDASFNASVLRMGGAARQIAGLTQSIAAGGTQAADSISMLSLQIGNMAAAAAKASGALRLASLVNPISAAISVAAAAYAAYSAWASKTEDVRKAHESLNDALKKIDASRGAGSAYYAIQALAAERGPIDNLNGKLMNISVTSGVALDRLRQMYDEARKGEAATGGGAGRGRNAPAVSDTLSAFRGMGPDAMRRLDEMQGIEAAGARQSMLDAQLASQQQQIAAHVQQTMSQVRADLESQGLDPDLGVMGLVIGKDDSTQTAMARIDMQALQMQATMARMAAATRAAAASSTQAFLSTLVATKSFGAAVKAAVKSYMDTHAQMSFADAGREVALAVGRFAMGDSAGGAMHLKSAGLHAAAGVAYGLVGGAVGGGGGGAGAGGGGVNNQFVGNAGIGANAPAGNSATTINVNVNVPPGGEARAGREFLASINAHRREQGRPEF